MRRVRRGEGGDDFGGGDFAGLAVAVVDAALGESVLAAAGAGFGVEFVERDDFLLGCELGEIDAGKFAGAFGVLQENLAGVLEGFHLDVADGQAEKRADFGFVEHRIAEAFVLLNDAAFDVEHERSRKRGDAAILEADVVAGNSDGIVDAEFGDELFDGVLIVVIDDESENLEAVFVFVLEIDEVGDFGAARSAPGGPEIQENDFAVRVGKCDGFSIKTSKLEIRSRVGVANEADGGLVFLLGGDENWNGAKK